MTFDRRRTAAYARVRFLAYGLRSMRDFAADAVARAKTNLVVRIFGGTTLDDLQTVEHDLTALLDTHTEYPLDPEED